MQGMCSHVGRYRQKPRRRSGKDSQLEWRCVPSNTHYLSISMNGQQWCPSSSWPRSSTWSSPNFFWISLAVTLDSMKEREAPHMRSTKSPVAPCLVENSGMCQSRLFPVLVPLNVLHERAFDSFFHPAKQRYDDLLKKLTTTTHKLIAAESCNTSMVSASSETREGVSQIHPVSFALSVEQTVHHHLIIQASIEYVMSPLFIVHALIVLHRIGRSRA